MKNSDGRSTSRLARVLGLIIVLGLPLAAGTPLDPGLNTSPSRLATDQIAANAHSAAPHAGVLEGYTPAAPVAAANAAAPVEVSHSAPPGAYPVTSIINDPRCGPGFTSVAGGLSAPYACVHTAPDALPPVEGPPALAAGAAAGLPCLGNGVNGPRIQLIYLYVEGQPNRAAQVVPRIVNQIVPNMDRTFRETSKLQGREIGLRLHMPGCKLAVDTHMIDEANGSPDNAGRMLNRVTEFLSEKGYSTTDRKYLVWLDAGSEGACGVAPAMTTIQPHVTDNAVTGNISNVGWQSVLPETALIFRYGIPILGDAPPHSRATECLGRGGTGAFAEIHELMHVLGSVNKSAPNSNGFGHCTDDFDIMCYGERGVSTVPRCATRVEQLDCGADDYFNARPPAGSYLSTHWNTANSRFLGPATVHDAVPVEIPRP